MRGNYGRHRVRLIEGMAYHSSLRLTTPYIAKFMLLLYYYYYYLFYFILFFFFVASSILWQLCLNAFTQIITSSLQL